MSFNPQRMEVFILFVFEVTAINFGYSFDVKFLKPLVLIDLIVINMRM